MYFFRSPRSNLCFTDGLLVYHSHFFTFYWFRHSSTNINGMWPPLVIVRRRYSYV
ncbi:hypothetical protein HanRHA438_Chr13g0626041 [Helianthus annuus]|nr:hypothetical protein HanRHA438_Chr13g0626041 [Helianthus annuus]